MQNNVQEDTYVPKHVLDGCQCEAIAVDTGPESLISRAIRRKDIPIVQILHDEATDQVNLEVNHCSVDHKTSYIAISHV